MSEPLRVAVVGAGAMGADHVRRLEQRIVGASVRAVVDPDHARSAAAVADTAQGVAYTSLEAALDGGEVDAVLVATPGPIHEAALTVALEREKFILCEKPLTSDAESSVRVMELEAKLGVRRIQVGFMRRFDRGYRALRSVVAEGELGQLLMIHGRHRNSSCPPTFDQATMTITEAAIHEFDIFNWLADSPLATVEVRNGRSTTKGHKGFVDPIMIVARTENDVLCEAEISMNARFGYEVSTEAVLEDGIVRSSQHDDITIAAAGRSGTSVTPGYIERFVDAYDVQIQDWVDATRAGRVVGPSTWDGYVATAAATAGVAAYESGKAVDIEYAPKPELYTS